MDKNQVKAMMKMNIDDKLNFYSSSPENYLQSNTTTTGSNNFSCWGYWRDHYYPQVIYDSYPIYIRERAQDNGKKAFEIIKMMKDKRFLKLETVGDFIDVMDELIKIL